MLWELLPCRQELGSPCQGAAEGSRGGSTWPGRPRVSEPQGRHIWSRTELPLPEERWAYRIDLFHLATHSRSRVGSSGLAHLVTWGPALSHYASVSPLHSMLIEAPLALTVCLAEDYRAQPLAV